MNYLVTFNDDPTLGRHLTILTWTSVPSGPQPSGFLGFGFFCLSLLSMDSVMLGFTLGWYCNSGGKNTLVLIKSGWGVKYIVGILVSLEKSFKS